MTTTAKRTLSIEAIALRAQAAQKHAEQDALILQDDLLKAHKQIEQLTAELDHLKKAGANGN